MDTKTLRTLRLGEGFKKAQFMPSLSIPLISDSWKKAITIICLLFFESLLAIAVALYPDLKILLLFFGLFTCLLCFQYPLFGLVLVTITLPIRSLDSSLTVGPIIIRLSQALTIPTALGWILHLLIKEKDRPILEPTPFNHLLYLFTFISLISVIWSISIFEWLQKNIQWILSLILFFMSVSLIKDQKMVKRFTMLWILIGVVVGIGAIIEFFGGGIHNLVQTGAKFRWSQIRSDSILKEPNDMAKYLTHCILFGIAYYESLTQKKHQLFLIMAQILMIGGIIFTFSRGSLLCLLIGLGFMFLRFPKFRALSVWTVVMLIMAIIISGKASLIGQIATERLLSSFTFLSSKTKAAEDIGYLVRTQNWEVGNKIFFDHPMLGIGLGGYGLVVTKFLPQETAESPYSLYLDILVSLGLIGFIFFMGFMITSIYTLLKSTYQIKDRFMADLAYTGAVIIIVKLFKGITGEVFIESRYMWLSLGLIMAAVKVSGYDHQVGHSNQEITN